MANENQKQERWPTTQLLVGLGHNFGAGSLPYGARVTTEDGGHMNWGNQRPSPDTPKSLYDNSNDPILQPSHYADHSRGLTTFYIFNSPLWVGGDNPLHLLHNAAAYAPSTTFANPSAAPSNIRDFVRASLGKIWYQYGVEDEGPDLLVTEPNNPGLAWTKIGYINAGSGQAASVGDAGTPPLGWQGPSNPSNKHIKWLIGASTGLMNKNAIGQISDYVERLTYEFGASVVNDGVGPWKFHVIRSANEKTSGMLFGPEGNKEKEFHIYSKGVKTGPPITDYGVVEYDFQLWGKFERKNNFNIPYHVDTMAIYTNQWGTAVPYYQDIYDAAAQFDANNNPVPEFLKKATRFEKIINKINSDRGKAWGRKNDHCFLFTTPYATTSTPSEGSKYVTMESNYNSYIPGYEKITSSPTVGEEGLPSMLAFAAEAATPEVTEVYGASSTLHITAGALGTSASGLEFGAAEEQRVAGIIAANLNDFLTLGGQIQDPSLKLGKFQAASASPLGHPGSYGLGGGESYFEDWSAAMAGVDPTTNVGRWQSQIILPTGYIDPGVEASTATDVNGQTTEVAAVEASFKKTIDLTAPSAYYQQQRFPMDNTITIGTQSKYYDHSLLNLLNKHHLTYALMRTVQEKVADPLNWRSKKEYWNFYEGDNQFDTFGRVVQYVPGTDFKVSEGIDAIERLDIVQTLPLQEEAKETPGPSSVLSFYRDPGTSESHSSDAGQQGEEFVWNSWAHAFGEHGSDLFHMDRAVIAPTTPISGETYSHAEESVRLTSPSQDGGLSAEDRILKIAGADGFIDDLNKLLTTKTRTYEEIMMDSNHTKGKGFAQTETLFWRVEKIRVEEEGEETLTGTPVQNFYFADPVDANALVFSDTQVKYGKKYKYKIYEWRAVFGTDYVYNYPLVKWKGQSNEELHNFGLETFSWGTVDGQEVFANWPNNASMAGSPNLAEPTKRVDKHRYQPAGADGVQLIPWTTHQLILDVFSYPSVKILEIPFFETPAIKMTDRPPLPPQVKITPYAGINNTYLVSVDADGGGEQEKEITPFIFPEDAKNFIEVYGNQHPMDLKDMMSLLTAKGPRQDQSEEDFAAIVRAEAAQRIYAGEIVKPVKYKGDDIPDFFEVFSIGPDPETGVTPPPTSYRDFAKAKKTVLDVANEASISFRPIVEPNKKYYYTFRTMDIHGHLSYPSPIYEVKLVDDGGAVYLTVDIYESKARERKLKKGMRKFLNITPALKHSMLMPWNEAGAAEEGILIPTYKSPVGNAAATEDGTSINKFIALGSGPSPHLFNNDKRYKIRLVSKNSGRKIDVNVKFKATRKKTRHDS